MNRRVFLKAATMAAAGTMFASSLVKGFQVPVVPQTAISDPLSSFTVEPDGILSRDGQTIFPVYGPDGGLAKYFVQYRLAGDPKATIKAGDFVYCERVDAIPVYQGGRFKGLERLT